MGVDEARPSLTLSSDTKNDVTAKGVEDSSLKTKESGPGRCTRVGARWDARPCVWAEYVMCTDGEKERENGACVWIS